MDVKKLHPETRDRVLAQALELSRRRVVQLDEEDLVDPQNTHALCVAVVALDDGRARAVQALQNARAQIVDTGSETDDVHVAVLGEIDYAVARLSGALDLRVDAELIGGEARVALSERALAIADAALQSVGMVDLAAVGDLADLQCLAAAYEIVVDRMVSLGGRGRGSRCTWCVRALGVAAASPLRDSDEILRHALECRHSPGAAAVRAVRAMAELDGQSGSWQELVQTLRRARAEVENLVTPAGVVHERDYSEPTSCPEPESADVELEREHDGGLAKIGEPVAAITREQFDATPKTSVVTTLSVVVMTRRLLALLGDGYGPHTAVRRAIDELRAVVNMPPLPTTHHAAVATFRGQPLIGFESPPPGQITVTSVRDCARCGGGHDELVATAFRRPVDVPEAGGVLWTHWATCPTSGDPVLVATTDKPGVALTDDVVEGLKRLADVAERMFPRAKYSDDDHKNGADAAVAWLRARGWRP